MDTTRWISRLTEADSTAQVLDLVNQYVSTRDPAVLAALPPECRVGPVRSPEEVSGCAYRLTGYHGHDEAARAVQRIASFFSHASFKLSELGRATDG